MFIFFKELTIDEGFEMLYREKSLRDIDGMKVSSPSGVMLWKTCRERNSPLKCWECGLEADRFIFTKHKNESKEKSPVLELFAHDGKTLVLMTRDHIIPASLGGLNHVDNLRPGCSRCNGKRKNTMSVEDQQFMDNNPHLRSR